MRSNEPDVTGIVGKLTQGAVDAGFVYVTDVNATGGELKAIELPTDAAAGRDLRRRRREGREAPERGPRVRRRAVDGAVRRRARRRGLRPAPVRMTAGSACCSSLAVTLAFLTLPVVAIFVDSSPAELIDSLGEPGALDALWLSLRTTAAALAIIVLVGTPAAYLLATRAFRGRRVVVTLVELPLVLPPAVAGIGLLAALGPAGHPRRRARGRRDRARAHDGGRGRGAHVRRRAVLPAPGEGRVRGGRPHAARRLAHARRRGGAQLRARRDPGRDAGARGRRGARAGAGRSASSARR